ncbi:MAG: electron transfer flavoprotein subunit YdiR [Deltaproteobacteria bacterium]|nr:electron transfer flavoprotein subunit YdiR [Deltaproteobacteria bacterium]
MGEIFVVVEHRKGEVREVTYQMLWKANDLCQKLSHTLTAVLLGGKDEPFLNELKERADKVIVVEGLQNFNGDLYKEILFRLIQENKPLLTLVAHTPWGMDFAPSLSVKLGYPIVTDCVDVIIDNGKPKAVRQIYSGKLFSRVAFQEAAGYLITIRSGAFPAEKVGDHKGEIMRKPMPPDLPQVEKQFVGFEDDASGSAPGGEAVCRV